MLKKSFIYSTLLLSCAACSVDEIETPSGFGPDGEFTVNLAVPEMETVSTRASEFGVSDVTMLVLSKNTVVDAQKYEIGQELTSTTTNNYKLQCTLSPSLRTKTGLSFYFIANCPATVTNTSLNGKTVPQLNGEVKLSSYLNDAENITMSASLSLSEVQAGTPAKLRRNIAKVTVRDGQKDASGNWVEGNTVYPVEVYGTAASSSVVAGTLTGTDYIEKAVTPSSYAFTGKDVVYVHPTLNPGRDVEKRPYMIVKAHYPATSTADADAYFYRLEFENIDDEGALQTLNILPNHHYQVMIEDVKGKGDKTVEAAVKNPTSLLEATIYDYCPEAFNMISDGTRELGVSSQLIHNGNPTAGTPEYIYVKLYSEYASELTNPEIFAESNNRWLSIGTPSLYTESEAQPIPGITGDYKGVIYRIPVEFNRTTEPGELSGKITVKWKGLERDIPVLWTREFDASDLCTVEFKIYDNNGVEKFTTGYTKGNDYWAFIRNENQIDGLSVEQNNGKVRNEGLHFPVNYGGQNARWKYEYKVRFNNLNNGANYDWQVRATGLSGITISSTSGSNVSGTAEFTITQDGSVANWNYEVGELIFEISKPGENNYTPYSIDLYHTGFFDNPKKFRSNTYRVDATEKDMFFYYEVIQGLSGDYYWLDRNLGATSAEYYIEADGDVIYQGRSDEPRGGYYKAAEYVKGGKPAMYSDLCPPGFEIPSVEVWNMLRNSSEFLTNRDGTSYLTEFTNAKGQTVYFPRSRYYDATGTKNGESRAGYYWSKTAADGFEKDQIGNWLRYLKFSGSISSYDNAEVEGRENSAGWAMSVRCVNIVESAQVTYRTFFNVSGATHVFLYSETDGVDSEGNPTVVRNSVTNWPGTSIGNYVTMGNAAGTASGTQLFNFVYESPTTHPADFYVIFTFRDKDGIWHTMSKNDDGTTLYSKDRAMSSLKGWKVIGDTSWDGKTTALGGTWACNFNGSDATVTYSDPTFTPPIIEPLPDNLTIYYTNPNNWSQVYVYAYNSDDDKNHTWPGVKMEYDSATGNYVGTISRHYGNLIFNNGYSGNGNQTPNLTRELKNNWIYTNGAQ
ncbi:MAG: starch-binding protein [Muribaculaceae bacterium]|nr:starch-binding protein [Muribaculaceae bacterium]